MLIWSAKSGSGTVAVTLPFTSSGTPSSLRAGGSIGYHNGIDYDGHTSIHWRMSQNSSTAALGLGKDQSASASSQVANMSATGEVQGTITFKTDS